MAMFDAVKLIESNRNTLKQHFGNLAAPGHLEQRGSGRGVWYWLEGGATYICRHGRLSLLRNERKLKCTK